MRKHKEESTKGALASWAVFAEKEGVISFFCKDALDEVRGTKKKGGKNENHYY